MREPQRIILYGNSLVLAGMAESFKAYPNLEIISLNASATMTPQELCACCPSVVIFDLATVQPEFPFAVLRERSTLLLLGIDPAGDKLLTLSGQQARVLTSEQLIQIIEVLPESPESDRR